MVFGKPLNAQPVIRAKLANMIARVEAGQSWLESITHQMNNVCRVQSRSSLELNCLPQMSYAEQSDKLAGPIGLLKQYASYEQLASFNLLSLVLLGL